MGDNYSKYAVIGFILSILVFVPLAPLLGLFFSVFYYKKSNGDLKSLSKISIVLSLIFILVQIVVFPLSFLFYSNRENNSYNLLLYRLDYIDNDSEKIEYISEFLNDYELNERYIELLIYRGTLYQKIGDNEKSLQDYLDSINYMEKNMLNKNYYSYVYIYAGLILSEFGDKKALTFSEEAQKLSPSYNIYKIYHGQMLENIGENLEALQFYQSLSLNNFNTEEKVIVKMKINKLQGKPNQANLPMTTYHPIININILPLNDVNQDSLKDICKILSYKFRMKCNIMNSISVDESLFYNAHNKKMNADLVIGYVNKTLNLEEEKYNVTVVLTDKNIYTEQANFLFSRHYLDRRIGVISSNMFKQSLPILPEKNEIFVRRLGIQFISSVGQLIYLDRPADPTCPLAFPNSLNEFLLKTSKICPGNQIIIDNIRGRSDYLLEFSTQEIEDIESVYAKYYFE
jgi:predicted Zn-dependent protease